MKIRQVVIGYTVASAATTLAGLVAADVWEQVAEVTVNRRLLVEVAWLVSVGGPSLWVAGEQTLRALGKKPTPPWGVSGRSVVVNAMESSVRSIFGRGGGPERRVAVHMVYPSIDRRGQEHTFLEDDVLRALRTAWRRRRNNPWSRNRIMATCQLSRDEYEAMMVLLRSVRGVVLDRGERRSGRIRFPPMMALQMVREQRGVPLG